jgi:hypothetical protein
MLRTAAARAVSIHREHCASWFCAARRIIFPIGVRYLTGHEIAWCIALMNEIIGWSGARAT